MTNPNNSFSPSKINRLDISEIASSVKYYAAREKGLVEPAPGYYESLAKQMAMEVTPDLPADPNQARRFYKLAVIKEILHNMGIDKVGN